MDTWTWTSSSHTADMIIVLQPVAACGGCSIVVVWLPGCGHAPVACNPVVDTTNTRCHGLCAADGGENNRNIKAKNQCLMFLVKHLSLEQENMLISAVIMSMSIT